MKCMSCQPIDNFKKKYNESKCAFCKMVHIKKNNYAFRFIRNIAYVISFITLLFSIYLCWVVYFSSDVLPLHCENVVVFTGGSNRISHSFQVAKLCNASKVFVSGVFKTTTAKNMHIDDVTYSVTLGREAQNTKGNAQELNKWIEKHNICDIIFVTSDYHMLRSILEIQKACKNINIYKSASCSKFSSQFLKICFFEFIKIMYMVLIKHHA